MYRKGITDVGFIVCNTDAQALANSPVPHSDSAWRITYSGACGRKYARIGEQAAIENIDAVVDVLKDHTNMVFITAGMGGGTGTGAAPVIAEACRKLNILTIAVVTVPSRSKDANASIRLFAGLKESVNMWIVCW